MALISVFLGGLTVYILTLVVYRLFLSPIANFPGPKLAALTWWYEFYYDVILRGQFTFQVQALHKKYGPIIRISPDELHINDSEFWDVLYAPGRVDKYERFDNRQNIKTSVFATPDSDIHRMRRAPLTPMFSKRRVLDFQPVIQQKVDILCRQIDKYTTTGAPLKISRALTAFAGDVITSYVYGDCSGHLEQPAFQETFYEGFLAASEAGHLCIQFRWIFPLMDMMPDAVVLKLQPVLYPLIRLSREIETKLRDITARDTKPDVNHLTILDELVESDLPPHEKTITRLRQEAQLLVAAGLLTVAWAMAVAVYFVVADAEITAKLQEELDREIPDMHSTIKWEVVEKLPYLSGVVREGVRLSYGVSARNPRLWHKPLIYKQWTIPPRTPVSMNIVDHNHNEDIFPDSYSFRPERWLEPAMDRHYYSFGKGSRSCLGVNLANAEMYLVIATLFRRYSFALHETDISDIRLKHDFFLPYPKLDSQGVRVVVKVREE